MKRDYKTINFEAEYNGTLIPFKNIKVYNSSSDKQRAPMGGVSSVVKQFLKYLYPHLKFQISSSTFSGGDDVTVYVATKATESEFTEIEKLVQLFRRGKWNGMEESYEYKDRYGIEVTTNTITYLFSTKWIDVQNHPKYGSNEYKMWKENV